MANGGVVVTMSKVYYYLNGSTLQFIPSVPLKKEKSKIKKMDNHESFFKS